MCWVLKSVKYPVIALNAWSDSDVYLLFGQIFPDITQKMFLN